MKLFLKNWIYREIELTKKNLKFFFEKFIEKVELIFLY